MGFPECCPAGPRMLATPECLSTDQATDIGSSVRVCGEPDHRPLLPPSAWRRPGRLPRMPTSTAIPSSPLEMSRKVITNVEKPTSAGADGAVRTVPRVSVPPRHRDVTAPNADTLYSNAFIDVSKGPWVVRPWPGMGKPVLRLGVL